MAFIKYTQGPINTIEEYYQCSCFSDEHMVKVILYKEDKMLSLIIALRKFNFWNRIIPAIKYLFGYECKYGHFDDFLFQPDDITSFRKVLEEAEKIIKHDSEKTSCS